jgi:hypothetical protein
MPKKVTTNDFIEKSKLIHGDKYDYNKTEYIKYHTPLTIICKLHGDFLQTPQHHLKNNGCPKCGFEKIRISKQSNISEFIRKSKLIHGNKYDYSKSVYISNRSKIIINCPIHGEFNQRPSDHISGRGCNKCGLLSQKSKKTIPQSNFIEKCKLTHGMKYDYSLVNYINNSTKIIITCKIHGHFLQNPNNHTNGQGCPKCNTFGKLTNNIFIEKSNLIHNNKYNYSNVEYITGCKKIKIICPLHGEFLQTPNNHLRGAGCIKCSKNISNKEIKFLDYLNIKKENRQIRINKFLVDAFDKPTNTIYEFLGDFWHGNPQKFDPTKLNHVNKQSFQSLYENTLNKFNTLHENGYKINYIWENDWDIWNENGEIPLKTFNGIVI